MTVATQVEHRWDAIAYRRIVAVEYDAGRLTVRFADGSQSCLPTGAITHPLLHDPDWSAVAADTFELRVPTPTGDFVLPWDSIRALTDPVFNDHLARAAASVTFRVGVRLRTLREERGLSVAELAGRAGVAETVLAEAERGAGAATFDELDRLLRSLGRTLDDLVTDR